MALDGPEREGGWLPYEQRVTRRQSLRLFLRVGFPSVPFLCVLFDFSFSFFCFSFPVVVYLSIISRRIRHLPCAHQPRHLFDYEDYFPLLNFPLTPLLHSVSSSSALAPFLRIAGVLERKRIRRFSVLYFTS